MGRINRIMSAQMQAVARESTAQTRAMGSPTPRAWVGGCGNSAWFSGVSGTPVNTRSYAHSK